MTGLVIFDCDGVLVDSEPISIAVLLEILGEAGVGMSEDAAFDRFLGRSMASIAQDVESEYGLRLTGAHLDALRARLHARLRRDLKPIPGVAEALGAIGAPRCVASSSQPERIRLSLAVTGLLESLEPHIYSSTMVENGKPAPDLFLHAARAMGAAPADCVVVEDSPAGIEAAQRAGMCVFAFTGGTHAVRGGLRQAAIALGADVVFDDMRRLPALLAAREEAR